MARAKKDGRIINYYIDRVVFERLEQYAQERGQTMTTALERIIVQFLDEQDNKAQSSKQ